MKPLTRMLGVAAVLASVLFLSPGATAQRGDDLVLRVGRLDANPPAAVERALAELGIPSGRDITTGPGVSGTGTNGSQAGGTGSTGLTTDTPDADGDADGLTDAEELAGWNIVIDENGYGTSAAGSLLTIVHVTSNPVLADTDGDGLLDGEESDIGSDPRAADTDGDLLDDIDEWNTWFTAPNSVDSDGDARGPGADLAPNVSLFDGYELDGSTPRTSPTLDDTDGDGRTDYEEFDHPLWSPLVAELPTAALSVEGDIDIRLDVEYAEAVETEKGYEVSLTKGSSSTSGTSKSSSDSTTTGSTFEATVGYSATVGGETTPPNSTAEATVSAEYSVGLSSEVTKEQTFEVSSESSKSSEKTSSEYKADTESFTETAASGSITVPFKVVNDGDFAYTLTNMGVTILSWKPDPTGTTPGSYKAMGTLTPDIESFTLSPGESTPIFTLDAGDVNTDVIKGFLANPSSLVLQPASFDMQNAEGVDFDFITETTLTQTALIEIDYGAGDVETHRVATNVDRDGFQYLGLRLDDALDMLGIPFDTQTVQYNGTNLTGENSTGGNSTVKALIEVKDVATSVQGGGVQSFWTVAHQGVELGVVSDNGVLDGVASFPPMRLFAGSSVRLVYNEDKDGDGLYSSLEEIYGSDDNTVDSDGDGMDDYKETVTGWQSPAASGNRVFSDPRNADTDFDGLDDDAERAANLDPQNPDTDGDGLADGADPFPAVPAVRLYAVPDALASAGGDGLSWGSNTSLGDALAEAQTRNNNGNNADDVSEIWCATGAYDRDDALNDGAFDFPVGNVQVYGGFDIGDSKLGDRNPDPITNQTVLFTTDGTASQIVKFDKGAVSAGEPAGTLDGFSITGQESGTRGIFVAQGVATLRNLLIVDNDTSQGAVKINTDGSVIAENVTFLQNVSTNHGGAVNDTGSLGSSWVDCEFSLNLCNETGGAYRAEGLVGPVFERCTFQTNQVYNESGFLQTDGGGAFYTQVGGAFLDCDFFGNRTQSTTSDNDYKYNLHALKGGAIQYRSDLDIESVLNLVNCRFFENTSGMGGAIFVASDAGSSEQAVNIINCSFVRNTALKKEISGGTSSGGLHVNNGAGSGSHTVVIRNSLFWDNMADSWLNPNQIPNGDRRRANIKIEDFNPLITDVTFSTIEGIYDDCCGYYIGNGNTDDNPAFLAAVAGNLRLAGGSSAIDAGIDVLDLDLNTPGYQPMVLFDLDGNTRIVDADGYDGQDIDRGAYEYQP